jgi:hypothetical protein
VIKKFFHGLLFGFGFSLSILVTYSVWMMFAFPIVMESGIVKTMPLTMPEGGNPKYPLINNFDELSIDQKIEKSTAILLTEIVPAENGKYKSKVIEVLKKLDDIELYYEAGDTYQDYEPYKGKTDFMPKGFIVFMGGSPATMMYSTSYSGERISNLGGIPLALLRNKCST